MRTNIEIDDKLMKDTMKATGAKTKREAVEIAMKGAVQVGRQESALRKLKGIALRGGWNSAYDYKKMRQGKGEW
jgi:Arc/MetJ family transcription regulator